MLQIILLVTLVSVGMALFGAVTSSRRLRSQSEPVALPALKPHLARLAEVLEVEKIAVRRIPSDSVNAMAAPDGGIYLTQGFVNRFRKGDVTPEELTSVVAHELGHVALGHAKRRMMQMTVQTAVRQGLMMVIARVIPLVGPYIVGALSTLITAKLSRSDEFEADAYATALMVKAGYGHEPQASMLRKVDRWSGVGGMAAPAWFASHPRAEDRVAAIEQNMRKWGARPS
ncbi:MAG: M48 family metallopeptidase [Shimia sp.]